MRLFVFFTLFFASSQALAISNYQLKQVCERKGIQKLERKAYMFLQHEIDRSTVKSYRVHNPSIHPVKYVWYEAIGHCDNCNSKESRFTARVRYYFGECD